MDLRELVILVLGLTIVGVVVRGLLVALKARKNQLRLAIDKNIPKDIDLEAIELAELPSGGARVVRHARDVALEGVSETSPEAQLVMQPEVPVGAHSDHPFDPSSTGANLLESSRGSSTSEKLPYAADEQAVEKEKLFSQSIMAEPILLAESSKLVKPVADPEPEELELATSDEDVNDQSQSDVDKDHDIVSTPDRSISLGDGIEDDEDEYSSISMSAGDRIGSRNKSVPTQSRKESSGKSLLGSLSAASRSFGALVSSRKAGQTNPDAPTEVKPMAGSHLVNEAQDVDSVEEGNALFEDYPKEVGDSGAEPLQPALTDLFPETFPQDDEPADVEPTLSSAKVEKTSVVKAGKKAKKFIAAEEVADSSNTAAPVEEKSTTSDTLPDTKDQSKGSNVAEVTEVLVLNVTAKKGRLIMGERLLSLMQGLDLQHGERNIFSKRMGEDAVIFNVANMLQPGTFDLNDMENFATVGITLFLALPSPISNFQAFEEMLQTAQDLVQSIDGELRDDQRNMMTGQTIEHYRQRVRDFELRRLRSRAVAG